MSAKSKPSTLKRRKASRGASPVAGQIDGLEARKLLTTILTDASGFKWDINDDGSVQGNAVDTGQDAYDGGHELSVLKSGGGSFVAFPDQTPVNEGGQELRFGPVNLADGVQVTRKVYVSFIESTVDDTRGFARFLDIVTNTSDTDTEYTLQTDTNLGSDSNTAVADSSNHTITAEDEDDWIETRDLGGNDPNIGYVRFGSLSDDRDTTSNLSLTGDDVFAQTSFTIPAGETRILMQFAYQKESTNERRGERLATLDPTLDPLRGMSITEQRQVINFRIDEDSVDADEDTDNDTSADAFRIPVLPTVPFENRSLHRTADSISEPDVDFYTFMAGDDGTASVGLTFEHDMGDIDLEVFEDTPFGLVSVGSSGTSTDNEFVSFPVSKGVFYFAKVFGAPNPDYTVTFNNLAIPEDQFDSASRNDTFETATVLSNNGRFLAGTTDAAGLSLDRESDIGFGGDVDFYRFTAALDGPAEAEIQFRSDDGFHDLDLAILDANGNVIAESASFTAESESIEFDVTGGDDYIIRVNGFANANYFMRVSTPEIRNDAFEPNNNLFQATPLGTLEGNQTLFQMTLPEFDQDFYQFTAGGAGSASVTALHDSGQDVRVNIYEVRRGNPIRLGSAASFETTIGTTYIAEVFDINQAVVPNYALNFIIPTAPTGGGDVSATLKRSNLIINGDDGDNIFDVSQSGSTVTVTGLFGTTINGSDSAQFNVNLADINVKLPDGHNRVHIDGVTTSDDIIVKGGDGIDEVYIVDSNVASDVNVNLLNNHDVFGVYNSTVKRVRAKTGNGHDQVAFDNGTILGDFNVNTGNGRDSVGLKNTTVGDDVNLVTSGGTDNVFADDFDVADQLKINLGPNDDTLWIRDSTGGKTTLIGGSDDDQIGLHNSLFGSKAEKGIESTSFGLNAGQSALDALFSDLDEQIAIFG
jgi:hypothetical protein